MEINPGILEAAEAMGATTWQTIRYFVLPETLGSIVLALTTGTIGLLGASAMAGYVGGGGVRRFGTDLWIPENEHTTDDFHSCSTGYLSTEPSVCRKYNFKKIKTA